MKNITLYRTAWCPFCQRAEALLKKQQQLGTEHAFELCLIDIDDQPSKRIEMQQLSKNHTVPQIFIDKILVGGYSELADLDRQGKLDYLLKE